MFGMGPVGGVIGIFYVLIMLVVAVAVVWVAVLLIQFLTLRIRLLQAEVGRTHQFPDTQQQAPSNWGYPGGGGAAGYSDRGQGFPDRGPVGPTDRGPVGPTDRGPGYPEPGPGYQDRGPAGS